ncbi:MAG: hypothetical protein RMK57_08760 [Bryobacterales bacterium]|nr:hypothetical protein [Bryobacteraceae bacterium]MDW8354606.1 hypothetical protein [Bryobacterales bacterium]
MAAAVPASVLLARRPAREEFLPTGILPIDRAIQGLPRGTLTELTGSVSSGKTTLFLAVLAQATARGEFVAVVDTRDAFDPASAAQCGVDLDRLVWVRCGGRADLAMKAADLLVHGGGFGVVGLDLAGVPARVLERIPLSWWWRFRRAVENTPTILLVLSAQAQAKSCASCWMEFRRATARWSGRKPFRLLRALDAEILVHKPRALHLCWEAPLE